MVGSRFFKLLLLFITHLMGKCLKIRIVRLIGGGELILRKETTKIMVKLTDKTKNYVSDKTEADFFAVFKLFFIPPPPPNSQFATGSPVNSVH